jgi:hypothetical protein
VRTQPVVSELNLEKELGNCVLYDSNEAQYLEDLSNFSP